MDKLMEELKFRLLWDPGTGAYDYVRNNNTFGEWHRTNFTRQDRDLCIRVLMQKAVYPDGEESYYEYTEFQDDEVVSYSINEHGGDVGFEFGSVIAASFNLVLDNTSHHYTSADFTDVRFAAAIGVKHHLNGVYFNTIDFEPFGVWSVTNVNASEQSTTVEISGMDMLGLKYEEPFFPFTGDEDAIQITYNSVTELLDSIISVWENVPYYVYTDVDEDGIIDTGGVDTIEQVQGSYILFDWTVHGSRSGGSYQTFLNSPPSQMMYIVCSSGDITIRQIISWVAVAIGCFVRIARDGTLEFKPYIERAYKNYWHRITASLYLSYTPQGVEPFRFNRLQGKYYPALDTESEETKIEAIDDSIPATPFNTIQLPSSPFATQNLISSIFIDLKNTIEVTEAEGMTVSIVGDPCYEIGDHCILTDLSNAEHKLVVNSMSAFYDGGFTMTLQCNLPSDSTAYSASFNASTNAVTAIKSRMYGNRQYQEAEVLTGNKWIDGKPLYRKVVHMTAAGTVDLSALNFDFIRLEVALGYTIGSNTTVYWCTSYYMSSNSYAVAYINGTNLIVTVGNNVHISNAYIILEYTKQTSN